MTLQTEIISIARIGYLTDEEIRNRLQIRFKRINSVETVARERRRLAEKGMLEYKPFKNKRNNGTHKRWRAKKGKVNAGIK
jgi:hypothetical protein